MPYKHFHLSQQMIDVNHPVGQQQQCLGQLQHVGKQQRHDKFH